MTTGIKTVIIPVKDLASAKELYGALLGNPYVDQPYYVGFRVGEQEIGLDPNGHSQGMEGVLGYCHVDDIEKSLDRLVGAGARARGPIRNVGGGRLIASIADADGNVIGLLQDPG